MSPATRARLAFVLLVLALLVALPYLRVPIYTFPEPAPFSGTRFLNPYADLQGHWQRANLHAHGRAWGGLTSGEQPNEEVARTYRSLGYSVPGISNYHHIAAFDGIDTMPLYEHGYNIIKRHRLAIGARRVEWFDLLLWQSLSHQQFVIDKVAASADLVALAHPLTRGAYDADALRKLTGYHLVEVANGTHSSEQPWDAALSSGRVVWALANDDTHDVRDPLRTAMAWNMIDAASARTADIVDALRGGHSYAVMRVKPSIPADVALAGVRMDGDTLTVSIQGVPSRFLFIGQEGAIRRTVDRTTFASYTFSPADTYVRAVISSPAAWLYLNPILRYDGAHVPAQAAVVDVPRTWLLRVILAAVAALAIAAFVFRRRRVARRAAPAAGESIEPRRRRTA